MNKKLLALYGLKWNPFSPGLPIEALHTTAKAESFCWRVEQGLIREGGFALITGDPGTGKSVVLRMLAERLGQLRDLSVGAITHPSGNLADFYREMGDLFGLNTHKFKIAPLRNIARTGPYLHDGRYRTLHDSLKERLIAYMIREASIRDTVDLGEGELDDLVAFLESLTGQIDQEYIATAD